MSIVKAFSVGEGDMFYIKHGNDNFSIIDCCMDEDVKDDIVKELKEASKEKNIVRFISTHPDDDHIKNLVYLNEKMKLLNFYCVKNEATKSDETDDFKEYCKLRDDGKKAFNLYSGCSRNWMNQTTDDRDGAGINILWPVVENQHYKDALKEAKEGKSPNNVSPIVKYELNDGVTILWMGDLETDFMGKVENAIEIDSADILFAPHHGRSSGKVPSKWLGKIDPKIIIVGEAPSSDLEYYDGYNTITQNTAGDIAFDCVAGKVHVYVSSDNYFVDFLDNEYLPNSSHGKYIGTLNL